MSDTKMDALTGEYQAALHELLVNFKGVIDLAVMRQDEALLVYLQRVNNSFSSVLEASENIHAHIAERLKSMSS